MRDFSEEIFLSARSAVYGELERWNAEFLTVNTDKKRKTEPGKTARVFQNVKLNSVGGGGGG
jgi:hypothetical protein